MQLKQAGIPIDPTRNVFLFEDDGSTSNSQQPQQPQQQDDDGLDNVDKSRGGYGDGSGFSPDRK